MSTQLQCPFCTNSIEQVVTVCVWVGGGMHVCMYICTLCILAGSHMAVLMYDTFVRHS